MASAVKEKKDLNALRLKAMAYFKENGIPTKIEEILNKMFFENPTDPYGYLASSFSRLTQPAVISEISAMAAYDGLGMPTIQTNVFCTVNNNPKLISTSLIACPNLGHHLEDRDKAELEARASLKAAASFVQSDLNNLLKGKNPQNQTEIDALLISFMEDQKQIQLKKKESEKCVEQIPSPVLPATTLKKKQSRGSAKLPKSGMVFGSVQDKAVEMFPEGSEAVSAVSQAVCLTSALTQGVPAYKHVCKLAGNSVPKVPLPMVTIIQGGKMFPGKLNCIKEFLLIPGVKMPLTKYFEHVHFIHQHVARVCSAKYGASAKVTNEYGALTPPFDQPSQALDLLQEAINTRGLVPGRDMYVALNAAAHEYFDYERGKYEVMEGLLKSPDEMIGFWSDIFGKYSSVLAIIDPVRSEELDIWMKLCEKLSNFVYIIGSHFYDRPGSLIKEVAPRYASSSGIVMFLERLNTISDIITCAKLYQGLKTEIVISTNDIETAETFIVDLAVGLNARFLKLGGPCKGERSCKINRLLQICYDLEREEHLRIRPVGSARSGVGEAEEPGEDILEGRSDLDLPAKSYQHTPFVFPHISIPTDEKIISEESIQSGSSGH
ncbi:enolase 4-like [Physella acuta]|uniref:enolase 4-like n=1 Tax=Physella acuta TaxID=109671 RepID=UPI0027DC43B8|nr:enolase 4-like [Physella acuta]XP_059145452.1 enolase 4-like [Physella acuta]XP_059145458.1 enolase 4-like [Physella acuta]XP_059145466.1 enolase 4-like [Physella acuta]